MQDFLSKVNILQGTASVKLYSIGSTLPVVARPWGMHHWCLQSDRGRWPFHPEHPKLHGLRLTHQPSPWIGDYGSMLITPFRGEERATREDRAAEYQLPDATLRANYLKVPLPAEGVTMEMAPTMRGAVLRFTFIPDCATPGIAFCFDKEHEFEAEGSTHLTIITRDVTGGAPENFALHLFGEWSIAPTKIDTLEDGFIARFAHETEVVELRLAGSFMSPEMARESWKREVAGRALEDIAQEGATEWNSLLGRAVIEAEDEAQERTFYSCLYRTLLFPRLLGEIDASGALVHYSPYDGRRHTGQLCTDNGFWDTHRTLYPLLVLLYPDHLGEIMKGWINASKQAGWSPKWASPGMRDCMIGTHFDAVLADVVVKGVAPFDLAEIYEIVRRNAFEQSDTGEHGRMGLNSFDTLGYVAQESAPYCVSRTLDFSYNDFCLAQLARILGRAEDEALFLKRAQNYRNIFDAEIGFMRGKKEDGSWMPWREFEWGWKSAYVEGSGWQHVFNVPHDPAGLAELFGGQEKLIEKLDLMLARPPEYEVGSYGTMVHEMAEMAAAPFGQYAHSNQPVHGFLFLYATAGQPERTSHWVGRVARELYSPDKFPGDEDNGEMAAWYIWACLGIYPACPGKPEYVRFQAVTPKVTLHVPGYDLTLPVESEAVIVSHESVMKKRPA